MYNTLKDMIISKYICDDSNIPVVEMTKDLKIISYNNAFDKVIGNNTNLLGVNLKKLFLIDSISTRQIDRNNYAIRKIRCTLNAKDGFSTNFHGVIISYDTRELIIFENYQLSEFDIIKQMSRMNIEMSTLTRELTKKNIALEKANTKINMLLDTDYLTKVYNRRYFYKHFEDLIKLKKRYKYPDIGLILADIDFFKKVNDNYGHDVGDKVLIEFAKMISLNLREEDIVARVGGEEFCILVRCECKKDVQAVADKLRKKCEEITVSDYGVKITASFGVTIYKEWENINSTMKRVDLALYDAKNSGRNQVAIK